MDRDEEYRLVKLAQRADAQSASEQEKRDGQDAKVALVKQHERALFKIAVRTRSRSESKDDLYQWAVYYFLECLKTFDPKFGYRLSTYTYNHVRLRVRSIAWRHGPVHLPPNARKTNLEACNQAFRLSSITGENFDRVEQQLGYADPEDFEDKEHRELLKWAMSKLDERSRRVLELRLDGWIFSRIGRHFCITRARAQQIEKDAVQRVTEHITRRAAQRNTKRLIHAAQLDGSISSLYNTPDP
jgi:RNA polymerase sigma factor (sigma-70 family)